MICLPKSIVDTFKSALKSGQLNPDDLQSMSSADRRTLLEGIVGKDDAKSVNALLESKFDLHDYQQGAIKWAQEVMGDKPQVARDIISRVNKMDSLLNPSDEKSFRADLVAKKIGAEVTPEESQKISSMAKDAMQAQSARDADPSQDNILKYGRAKMAFGEYLNSLKPAEGADVPWYKNTKLAADIASIPKSILTSLPHFSAPFVQLWGMMATPEYYQAIPKMFQFFASEDNYRDSNAMILGDPDYELLKKSGVGLTSIDAKLSDREEAIQSSLVQKAGTWLSEKTHTPDAIRAFSRAFTGTINYVRAESFYNLVDAARLQGKDVSAGSALADSFARITNNFTGRGEMGRLDNLTPELNAAFFSPRKIAATFQMFNPIEYATLEPEARAEGIKRLLGSTAIITSLVGLSQAVGYKTSWNPLSTDFLKVGSGNTTANFTGGNSQWVTFLSRMLLNRETNAAGKTNSLGGEIMSTSKTGKPVKTPYTEPDRIALTETYFRNLLSPMGALVADWMAEWKDTQGNPVTISSVAKDNLTPLVVQAMTSVYENDKDNFRSILLSLASVFGVSVESNAPYSTKKK